MEEKIAKKYEVRRFDEGHACVLIESKEGEANPAETKVTPTFYADLNGADVVLISRFCQRFGFGLAQLVDECRFADSRRSAEAACAKLAEALTKEGADK